jgi:hypothetical protein
MNEIWKEIPNYEGFYEASNLGNIRSMPHTVPCKGGSTRFVKSTLKKLQTNRKGYLITTLSKNNVLSTFTVHQLIALTFIPDFIKSTELNHINGIKTDNRVINLEVSNPSHNQFHAVRTGLIKPWGISNYRYVYYVKNPKAVKKWAACIRHNGKSSFGWKTFHTEIEAAQYADELLDSIGCTDRLRNFP